MKEKQTRSSNLEILRIFCILFIIADHFVGQSGIVESGGMLTNLFYCSVTSLSRVSCSVFVIISAWFLVDKVFSIKRIFHTWLTVIMYTVPITLYCSYLGLASKEDVVRAFFPVEESPLWFAGYYIILVFFSPLLNFILEKCSKIIIEYFICIMLFLMVIYQTIMARGGFFAHDIWSMIFVYILTGYIKKYYRRLPNIKCCLFCFGCTWVFVTLLRVISQSYANISPTLMSTIGYYGEFYRSRLQTLPNLLMAYSCFFLFYNLKIKSFKAVNYIASASLGVYCFHQVPSWYTYLWKEIFDSTIYANTLFGWKRCVYVICSILVVWALGTAIELVRSKLTYIIIESRNYYNSFCKEIDRIVNTGINEIEKNQKRILKYLFVIGSIYLFILKAYSIGFFDDAIDHLIVSSDKALTNSSITILGMENLKYKDGTLSGTISVRNDGERIAKISSGTFPVNIGISVVDNNENIVNLDYARMPIKKIGSIGPNEIVELEVSLCNLQNFEDSGYGIRFALVQEGIAWMEDSSVTFWLQDKHYTYGQEIYFNSANNSGCRYFLSGFSGTEEQFTWTDGYCAEMLFEVEPTNEDLQLEFTCGIFGSKQSVDIYVNEYKVSELEVVEEETLVIQIPNHLLSNGDLQIKLELPDAVSPKELVGSEDSRLLGLCLQKMKISEIHATD